MLDLKYFLPNMLLFKNAPENDPYLGNDFFWCGSDGKGLAHSVLVLWPVDKKFSCRVIWSLFGCLVVGCGARATLTIERLPTLYLYYKINVYVHGRRNGSKNLWRISEAGECTSELLELTSRDCAQLLLGCRRAASCFFKWRPGLFFFCHGHCWLLNRRITETP